jgi:rubrerythrin
MHIDSGNMILFRKAQNLEVVKTPEALTDRELTRAIRDAIIAEEGAIKQYETVVDATSNEVAKKVLTSIADEERIHVGELQKLLNDILPDEKDKLEEGAKEVEDKKNTKVEDKPEDKLDKKD